MVLEEFPLTVFGHVLIIAMYVVSEGRFTSSTCGYDSCNPVKDDMLNIHLVPHTHDDVGWTKTYEEYYRQDVRKIISSVVDNLERDRQSGGKKRFIYVEMAFLKLWWLEQDNEVRNTVRILVNEGRLEIVMGGWCMNDEATPYYTDIIDQHTLGLQFIRENFGDCGRPKVGWQIDPFGHSREVASLFAQFGFDGMFIGRIDYQDKRQRERTKTMEMLWKTSDSLSSSVNNIFAGVLDNVYWPPKGFCWDYWCSDPELVNRSDDFKKTMVDEFIRIIHEEANHYATNHVMVEMGSDFQYRWADKWYENLDELIKLINEKQAEDNFKINALYSTPSCYLYQLHRANKTWSLKKDDFFPYAHRDHSFWTGYFTSRPHLKLLVRRAGSILQSCKQLNALAKLENTENEINYLKEAMAVVQHHDGVSGTEKQYVADDYTRLLHNGIHYCKEVIHSSIRKVMASKDQPELHECDYLPLQACNVTESVDKFSVVIYNSLARKRDHFVRLPVLDGEYEVWQHDGRQLVHQLLPISNETKAIPERPKSQAQIDIVFKATLPALGVMTFLLQKKENQSFKSEEPSNEDMLEEEMIDLAEQSFAPLPYKDAVEIIENQFYTITVDRKTGLISRLWNKLEDVAISLKQNFFYYISHSGYNYNGDEQASGAYIFRPTSTIPKNVNKGLHVDIIAYKGVLVQEIRQVFCSWVSQVIRLYDNQSHIELEWTIGPLPSADAREGREVITKYMTDLETEGAFYTDLNGRETLKRRRDRRDTWELHQSEPVAGNYYPITSRVALKDERRDVQLTVLVDRSQGAASIQDGNLEIMVHRRTFFDDALGVDEPLTEYGASGKGIVVRGKHFIMLNKISKAASVYRTVYHELYNQPFISFSSYTDSLVASTWSAVHRELPRNVHLLTLEIWKEPVVKTMHLPLLLRLEHVFEKFEDVNLSNPVLVDLQNLFKGFRLVDVIELALGANMKIEEMNRFVWKYKHDVPSDHAQFVNNSDKEFEIQLTPMQIRTFQINVERNL